jgi:hypothetical protein
MGARPAVERRVGSFDAKEVGFDAGDDQFALNKLPRDKNAPLIMYCDGTICWKGYKNRRRWRSMRPDHAEFLIATSVPRYFLFSTLIFFSYPSASQTASIF